MTESVVFFRKHDILNVLTVHLVNVISHLKCTTLGSDSSKLAIGGCIYCTIIMCPFFSFCFVFSK